jgi:hypothetical protein
LSNRHGVTDGGFGGPRGGTPARRVRPTNLSGHGTPALSNIAHTENESAKICFEKLTLQLEELGLPVSVEDVVSAVSFVWSVSFNLGRLLLEQFIRGTMPRIDLKGTSI